MVDISLNIARTNHILRNAPEPRKERQCSSAACFPSVATATIRRSSTLPAMVSNLSIIANFIFLAGSNPAAYSIISHSNYYTASTISVGSLVRAYPHMGGLSEYEPLGQSHFQEFLFHLTHRWSYGLSLMGSFEVNDQHDADYFNNPYDPLPSFEPSNYSMPTRLTVEEVWALAVWPWQEMGNRRMEKRGLRRLSN